MPTLIRPRDLPLAGVSAHRLRTLVRSGAYERVSRGVYLNTAVDYSEHLTVGEVFKRVPNAVVCLYSALQIHQIGTQSPGALWIAIDHKARLPRLDRLPVRIVRFSGRLMKLGVEERIADGVPYRITSPARSVVDCFRFRKLGLDVALEALKETLRERRASVDEINELSRTCRIRSVMKPYMEAMLA
jgi:predicted transcriptional regulator of viral defense system